MGKKNKMKKHHDKEEESPSKNDDEEEEDSYNKESDGSNEEVEDKPSKKKFSKEMRKKLKKIHKKKKKRSKSKGRYKLDYQHALEEFEDFLIGPEDFEKLPHDSFTPYNIPTTMEENKEYIPLLISESDIILELLDARDIYHSKNKEIEDLINDNEKKLLIFVITKSDLVSEEYLIEIEEYLEKQYSKNPIIITSSLMREKIQNFFDELKDQIDTLKSKNYDKKVIKIGIIGSPNVGKNSLLQSLELIFETNCDEKYIYFNNEKNFCVNSVPAIIFDENEENNFLISKKFKEISEISEPLKLINNLMDVVNKNKLKDIYEFNQVPENLDEFIGLVKAKYECEDKNTTICKIVNDIITGKIYYEVNN